MRAGVEVVERQGLDVGEDVPPHIFKHELTDPGDGDSPVGQPHFVQDDEGGEEDDQLEQKGQVFLGYGAVDDHFDQVRLDHQDAGHGDHGQDDGHDLLQVGLEVVADPGQVPEVDLLFQFLVFAEGIWLSHQRSSSRSNPWEFPACSPNCLR